MPLSRPAAANPVLAWAFTIALGLSPVLLMSTMDGGSAGYYLLILLSFVVLAVVRAPAPGHAWCANRREYVWLGLGMAVMLVGVLASQLFHGLWKGSEVEKAVRFLTVVLVLAAALRIPRATLAHALFGLLLGIWYAVLNVAWLALSTGGRPATRQFNAVTYGDLTLLFSMLAFLLLGYRITRFRRTEFALKLITGIAGVGGFLATQTRGGLLAIPFFIFIALLVQGRRLNRYKALAAAVLLGVLGLIVAGDGTMRQRIQLGVNEFDQCQVSHLADTSVCIRLQLWSAAGYMIQSEPVFGIGGGDRFRQELRNLAEAKLVSPMVARDFGETHNDLLYFLATYGVLGGLGLVLMYLSPAWVLLRRLRLDDGPARLFAGAGLMICVGFMVFGFTEMMFRDMRTASFYATWVALFLALSDPARLRWPGAAG
ncbi:O-antigen ligase family protein [Stenotrophomonas rhizophila]|uniref:O-antigen ligase family protein n=1 Tax=Stenotrophomonas rhizophila TaxID=216778 RepID=UPI001E495554|nr:O-antigen ligase family protein [Stenotrophomonas rhizophila]MCC7634368.1 O-antigen ligase family protein [Stenotrophomonas rhizophila]MCC7664062.1 O-antigen ligase family protein [Stenotrophomonas rhizophila]